MTVRFSTRCPNSDYLGFETSPEAIVAAATKAEEVGFDAIFVNDHIIVDSSSRAAPWTNVYDPFVAMSFIAAHTTRIGVGVSVLIMPYRNPVGLVVDGQDAVVGDGDAEGVAGEIVEGGLLSLAPWRDVNDPGD